MSLASDQTGREIPFGEGFFVSKRDGLEVIAALAHPDIDPIPEEERRQCHCSRDEPGLDIYQGVSEKSRNPIHPNYQAVGWRAGEFLFSISHETAMRYLPRHYHSMIELIRKAS